ncbi:hypothetical protein FJTKL_10637 [Diaporthe vaccinii]|uniref:Secreted protein n=1 Tax=Diaporthe vaccinii TaxID=105482 RepID=A0ABR4EJI2_9PEZI
MSTRILTWLSLSSISVLNPWSATLSMATFFVIMSAGLILPVEIASMTSSKSPWTYVATGWKCQHSSEMGKKKKKWAESSARKTGHDLPPMYARSLKTRSFMFSEALPFHTATLTSMPLVLRALKAESTATCTPAQS